jgi:hypothetical protein
MRRDFSQCYCGLLLRRCESGHRVRGGSCLGRAPAAAARPLASVAFAWQERPAQGASCCSFCLQAVARLRSVRLLPALPLIVDRGSAARAHHRIVGQAREPADLGKCRFEVPSKTRFGVAGRYGRVLLSDLILGISHPPTVAVGLLLVEATNEA